MFSSPEFRLLLLCAKPHLSPDEDAELASLTEIVDWPALESSAKRHNIEALVFARFEHQCRAMPNDTWQRLREEYLYNARQNLMLSAELLRLHSLLTANSLTFLPYKGPALAARAYGNIVLRRSLDLDLLLPANELVPATRLLAANGYLLLDDWIERVLKELLKYRGEYQLRNGDTLLELQWRLAPSYYGLDFDIEQIAARTTPAPLSGEMIPMLAPEDHLLVLAAHGWKELWSKLSWVADIAHLLATYPQLEWSAILERAQKLRILRMMLVAVNLASKLFDAPIPQPIRDAIQRDPAVASLTSEAIQRLQSQDASEPTPNQLLAYRENLTDRLRFLSGLALNPTENEWALTTHSSALRHRALRVKRVLAKLF